jgi:hypothetical protein
MSKHRHQVVLIGGGRLEKMGVEVRVDTSTHRTGFAGEST